MRDATLVKLDRAKTMLAEARTLREVKRIRDVAQAARVYCKAAHMGREAMNLAAEIKLLAERKAGEMLKQLAEQSPKGGQPTHKRNPTAPSVGGVGTPYQQTLRDTNTPGSTARFWQKVAAVPPETVAHYITTVQKKDRGEITTAGLLREAAKTGTSKPEKSALTILYEKLSALFTESANCPTNLLPEVVRQLTNGPVSPDDGKTLRAVVNYLGLLSKVAAKYGPELREFIKAKVAA